MPNRLTEISALSLLIIGVCALPCRAGGASWEVLVERAEIHSRTSATITLKTVDKQWGHPQCPVKTVIIEYRPELFGQRTWSKSTVTEATHVKAVEYLRQAHTHRKVIRFGEIGEGLVREEKKADGLSQLMGLFGSLFNFGKKTGAQQPDLSPAQACTFNSRGVAVLDEHAGKQAVYSFYSPI